MMDTSDGLADALITIANESSVMLEIDFERIPYEKCLLKIPNYKDLILYGGEDYGLVVTVENAEGLTIIGEVKEGCGVKINYKNSQKLLMQEDINNKIFNHFKE